MTRGDTSNAWEEEGLIVREGTISQGAQEQFYLEPHVVIVDPGEDDELTVHVSTQVGGEITGLGLKPACPCVWQVKTYMLPLLRCKADVGGLVQCHGRLVSTLDDSCRGDLESCI